MFEIDKEKLEEIVRFIGTVGLPVDDDWVNVKFWNGEAIFMYYNIFYVIQSEEAYSRYNFRIQMKDLKKALSNSKDIVNLNIPNYTISIDRKTGSKYGYIITSNDKIKVEIDELPFEGIENHIRINIDRKAIVRRVLKDKAISVNIKLFNIRYRFKFSFSDYELKEFERFMSYYDTDELDFLLGRNMYIKIGPIYYKIDHYIT